MKTIIFIIAPTSSGKTTAALRLSKEIDSKLIHADHIYNFLKNALKFKGDASKITDYQLWSNPRNFDLDDWSGYDSFHSAKEEAIKKIYQIEYDNYLIIEGFTTSFWNERTQIIELLKPDAIIVIRIKIKYDRWLSFYQDKFGLNRVPKKSDFERLTNCFEYSYEKNQVITEVTNPEEINKNFINEVIFKMLNNKVEKEINMKSNETEFFINKEEYMLAAENTFNRVPEIKNKKYWSDFEARWIYHERAIQIMKLHGVNLPSKVLELGTMGVHLVKGSHLFDYGVNLEHNIRSPEYLHDARKLKWPIKDGAYEWFIALRVFHHLWPVQRECFEESMRIAKNIIIVVPNILPENHNLGTAKAITPEQVRAWNNDKAPDICEPVGNFGILYCWIK